MLVKDQPQPSESQTNGLSPRNKKLEVYLPVHKIYGLDQQDKSADNQLYLVLPRLSSITKLTHFYPVQPMHAAPLTCSRVDSVQRIQSRNILIFQ